jgi:hypothetical protein
MGLSLSPTSVLTTTTYLLRVLETGTLFILISHERTYNDYLLTTGARDGDTIHQPAFTGNAVYGPDFRKQPQKGFTVRISAY